MELTLKELIRRCELGCTEEEVEWDQLRQQAFGVAAAVFEDRAESYNYDHIAVDEMKFGPLSIASELYKRSIRMCGILTPLRPSPLRERDLNRLADLSIDLINIASWQYALIKRVLGGKDDEHTDDAPDYRTFGVGGAEPQGQDS